MSILTLHGGRNHVPGHSPSSLKPLRRLHKSCHRTRSIRPAGLFRSVPGLLSYPIDLSSLKNKVHSLAPKGGRVPVPEPQNNYRAVLPCAGIPPTETHPPLSRRAKTRLVHESWPELSECPPSAALHPYGTGRDERSYRKDLRSYQNP